MRTLASLSPPGRRCWPALLCAVAAVACSSERADRGYEGSATAKPAASATGSPAGSATGSTAPDAGVGDASARVPDATFASADATQMPGFDATSPTSEDGGVVCNNGGMEDIAIVTGNGEVLLTNWPDLDPLVVQVTRAGQPVACETVTWTTSASTRTESNVMTTLTDGNGLAHVELIGGNIQPGTSFISGTATATIPTGSVTFLTTTTWESPQIGPVTASALLTQPNNNLIGPVKAGTVLTAGVQVVVAADTGASVGAGIPNVGIRLTNANDISQPAPGGIACVGGTVLTDAQGQGSCDVVVGSTPGTYPIAVAIGGFDTFPYVSVTITP
jgi:hypothetical protein